MKRRINRPTVMIIIICIALAVGILTNALWTFLERLSYPKEYEEIIAKYSTEYDVAQDIIYSIIKVESNFDPYALSRVGARGLMQIMPETFIWLTGEEHLNENLSIKDLYDPEVNIKYGTYYFKYLYTKFDHNLNTAFAAYNGGEGNVTKWLANSKYSDGKGNITDFPKNFYETENYVRKVNKALKMYKEIYN